MTLQWRRGMTFGEFQDMLDEHHRGLEEERRAGIAAADRRRRRGRRCVHPFDESGLDVTAHKAETGVRIVAEFRCTVCGEVAGARVRLLPFRKAKVAT